MCAMRFRKIKEDDLEMVMNWRMQPDVTMYMSTDPKLTIEKQRQWFEKISGQNDSFYWIVEADERPCGVVCLHDWDKVNEIVYGGSYIAEKDCRTLRNILDMHMNLYAYAIEKLKVNRYPIDVLGNNQGQLQWIERFGAKKEGVLRQAVKKNGVYYDVHMFSILASEWDDILSRVKFQRADIE